MNKFQRPVIKAMEKCNGRCICKSCEGDRGKKIISFDNKKREWRCYLHNCGTVHWKYVIEGEVTDIFRWKDRRSKDVI